MSFGADSEIDLFMLLMTVYQKRWYTDGKEPSLTFVFGDNDIAQSDF